MGGVFRLLVSILLLSLFSKMIDLDWTILLRELPLSNRYVSPVNSFSSLFSNFSLMKLAPHSLPFTLSLLLEQTMVEIV
jgi:hypothetical protein